MDHQSTDGGGRPPQGSQQWQDLKLGGIRQRLAEVSGLLRQAAAVGLAQDVARMERLTELTQQGQRRGDPNRRRYR